MSATTIPLTSPRNTDETARAVGTHHQDTIMQLPLSAIWLDAAGVAAMLSVTTRQWRERIACLPDAPKAVRIVGAAHARWNAQEIDDWLRAQRELTGGRPRAVSP